MIGVPIMMMMACFHLAFVDRVKPSLTFRVKELLSHWFQAFWPLFFSVGHLLSTFALGSALLAAPSVPPFGKESRSDESIVMPSFSYSYLGRQATSHGRKQVNLCEAAC